MFIVAPQYQIMTPLGSKDSSRNLHASCAIGFLFYPYLMVHVVQTFMIIFLSKHDLR